MSKFDEQIEDALALMHLERTDEAYRLLCSILEEIEAAIAVEEGLQ